MNFYKPKYWLTSDSHFGHTKILEYQYETRGHFKSIQDHDECLIYNWNKVVNPKDYIFHCGDFAFGNREYCFKIRNKLNGNIGMIAGNHDSAESIKRSFAWYRDVKNIKIDDWTIFLSHYAHLTWPSRHSKSMMFHGHSHGKLGHNIHIGRFDVGVDSWNLIPVSFESLKDLYLYGEDYQI